MIMLRASSFLLLGIVSLTFASSLIPRQNDGESLKSALDAVTRKQRSLDFSPRDYYNDLQNFKYHPSDGDNDEEQFARQQNQDLDDDDDEDLEFLPIENGQLENIGGGYQNFNYKRLQRALYDYFENSPGQRETPVAPSSFRERERTGGHKRSLTNDRLTSNVPDKDLATLLYKELQKDPLYGNNNIAEVDNEDYLLSDTLQSYYDRYLAEQANRERNKIYEGNSSPMSWGEIFGKHETSRSRNGKKTNDNDEVEDESVINGDYGNRERDQNSIYLLPAERRNVNGRYPLGRDYGVLLKRYPLTKRSPRPLHHDKEPSGIINDPKVAKDLGALFGGEKTDDSTNNRTSDTLERSEKNDHDRDNNQEHDRDHSDHDHDHEHEHSGHDHDKHTTPSSQRDAAGYTSVSPKSLINSPKATPGQKEITNTNSGNNKASKLLIKRNNRNAEVLTKKSVDWSQYFGIDRRKKKASLLARPGTQDQDDEWMLQRYYKTMAENLKSPEKNVQPEKDNGEKRDKLDQMDARLKNVKNLIVEDALKYGNDENSDDQEVKDVVMARLAAAYSLEKMRRALDEFRSNIAAQRDLMRASHVKNNETNGFRVIGGGDNEHLNDNKKRNGHGTDDDEEGEGRGLSGRNYEGFDEGRGGCPEFERIVSRCPTDYDAFGSNKESCIMYQICRACDDDDSVCSRIYAFEAEKICEKLGHYLPYRRIQCVHYILNSLTKEPSPMVVESCHLDVTSCLRRSYRYRHRKDYYRNNGWPSHVALDPTQLAER